MFVIDEEFKHLIPPLAETEFEGLEQNIINEGCRDPLVLWNNTLIDGHNRYEICTKHNIPFTTVTRDFDNRDDVILWILKNQLGRRNLTDYDRGILAMKLKPFLEKKAKANQASHTKQGFQKSEKPVNTTKELADIAGVSIDTMSKIIKIEKEADDETKDDLTQRKTSINKVYGKIRTKQKNEEITRAERAKHEQAPDEFKPYLTVGDGIGFVPDERYDVLMTDPPYSTDVDNIEEFVDGWLYNALDNVKDTGFAYVFIGAYPEEQKAYLNARIPDHIKLEQMLVWSYKNTLGQAPKDKYNLNHQICLFYKGINAPNPNFDNVLTEERWTVQEVNAPDARQGNRYHTWQKPMEIAERFVRHSTKPGMTVFDPFACTGTFLLAATKLGRKAYGFEIDPDNAAIAFERGCVRSELL